MYQSALAMERIMDKMKAMGYKDMYEAVNFVTFIVLCIKAPIIRKEIYGLGRKLSAEVKERIIEF